MDRCFTGPAGPAVTAAGLEHGRESYTRRAWGQAYDALSHSDQAAPLGADDLELLATSS